MTPIDRLVLVKALHFFHVSDKIREAKPESLAELSRMAEEFKLSLSDWPYTDLEYLGVAKSEATEMRAASDFEKSSCLLEGLQKAISDGVNDPKEWLRAIIACHPDTVYGPSLVRVRNGTAEEVNAPPESLGQKSDSNREVRTSGEDVHSGPAM